MGSGSKGNCYHVSDGENSLLLEAGIPFREIQKGIGFKVSELSGCLITHEHGDHAKAVKDMLKAGIDCWMSSGTARELGISDHHRVKTVKHSEIIVAVSGDDSDANGFMVRAVQTKHDAAEPLGFYVRSDKTGERLLYITDTCYVPNRFQGMTQIMIEINYCADILDANVKAGIIDSGLRNRIVKSHMSLDTALEFFKANNLSRVSEIWLLHLSDANSDAQRILESVQKCTGKVVKIA